MNKKVIVFLLVLVGLGGFVWWQTSAPQSAQDRLAKAMNIMQGLESRAIPVALTGDQIKLLEQVYQDSLERIPNIQGFRDTDRNKLISTLQSAGLTGTGINRLNPTAEQLVALSSEKTDVFASKINGYMTNLGTTVSGTVATNIKKLAQSVNTLTNDIRLTKLYVAWYEGIRAKICTTNDPNNDIYISGEVKMVYTPNTSLQDSCRSDGAEVKQYKCINGLYEDTAEHVSKTQCPNGCSGGVCLREETQELTFDMPATGLVGVPVPINVSLKNNYNQTFFIIVEGDDDAEYPTGALKIMSGEAVMSGEASRKFEIKFSKAGNMTVIVRPRTGPEASGIIGVTTGDTGGGGSGYTVSCTSITGASVAGCNECRHIDLSSSSMAQSVFVPRSNIPTGSKEYIVSGQATITAQTYQGAQVTPTGNIKNVFDIFESAPTNAPWQWTRMKAGNLVIKGNTQPTSIISNNPIYSIRYKIPSVLKNAAGSTAPGTSKNMTQCHFYYNTPTPIPVENCTDSDGTDYFTKGVVKSASFDPTYDSCDNPETLSEKVCRPYKWQEGTGSCSRPDGCIDIIKYKCPNGCSDGACKKEEKAVCTSLTLTPTFVSQGGKIEYTCTGTNAKSYLVTVRKAESQEVIGTFSTGTGNFVIPENTLGTYSVDCTINEGDSTCINHVTSFDGRPSLVLQDPSTSWQEYFFLYNDGASSAYLNGYGLLFRMNVPREMVVTKMVVKVVDEGKFIESVGFTDSKGRYTTKPIVNGKVIFDNLSEMPGESLPTFIPNYTKKSNFVSGSQTTITLESIEYTDGTTSRVLPIEKGRTTKLIGFSPSMRSDTIPAYFKNGEVNLGNFTYANSIWGNVYKILEIPVEFDLSSGHNSTIGNELKLLGYDGNIIPSSTRWINTSTNKKQAIITLASPYSVTKGANHFFTLLAQINNGVIDDKIKINIGYNQKDLILVDTTGGSNFAVRGNDFGISSVENTLTYKD